MNWSAIWGGIREFFSIIGDIGIFGITVYTFVLTFFPIKLRYVSCRQSFDAFQGDGLEITLANQSLSPAVVEKVGIIHEGSIVPVFDQSEDGECIIESFKTEKIKMKPVLTICIEGKHIALKDIMPFKLYVQTSRNTQFISYKPKCRWLPQKGEKELIPAYIQRRCVNNVSLGPQVKYVLAYVDDNKQIKTIFINRAGVMSEKVFGYNALPQNMVGFEEKVRAYFRDEFENRGIGYHLVNLDDNSWGSRTKEDLEEDDCIH